MVKQVIVCRKLDIGKGKLCAQVAHASLDAALKVYRNNKELFDRWYREGAKKVVLKVNSLEELLDIAKKAMEKGIVVSIIRDAGKTQVSPGTIICIALGPDEDEKIDQITGNLKLY
ncbi:NEQ244 [Nanoarchaeum equitans Kin4-M]|uniref:Peptidyl-tRNA hydrolase n=1 Tax=Nanoarchaeum equitans (strain Kin4-M) TaxID=228908 RepID=PTH_NANEQ|nr:RecName: Full=Peptidyl-tRNA hydrolase; Short=PTH [Nanoarchaeum equitans Kin4-M]AAR39098.1 NEQ244 [Nanoarchaeum equitans Kin4-M]